MRDGLPPIITEANRTINPKVIDLGGSVWEFAWKKAIQAQFPQAKIQRQRELYGFGDPRSPFLIGSIVKDHCNVEWNDFMFQLGEKSINQNIEVAAKQASEFIEKFFYLPPLAHFPSDNFDRISVLRQKTEPSVDDCI